jgi:hypothetical protein
MRGYIIIPKSVPCRNCKYCGSRPIIAPSGKDGYVVKCPTNTNHYQTPAGLINLDDWNNHNIPANEFELESDQMVACYDSKLNYTFFLPV